MGPLVYYKALLYRVGLLAPTVSTLEYAVNHVSFFVVGEVGLGGVRFSTGFAHILLRLELKREG